MTEVMKPPSNRSRREDVVSYTDLINRIATETGVKKGEVRKILESFQAQTMSAAKSMAGMRIHLGRMATLYSRMTSERTVNNPKKPGETLISHPHLVLRIDPGTKAQEFLTAPAGTVWGAEVPETESEAVAA